ncbi:MAG TPA: AI-2E family transporter [Alphaproteobacteria bacterium]|nr:AI-2E family transporter [Alphaproteobacteria bacterium]
MAVSARTQMTFWGAAVAFLAAFLWLFNDILTPFVLGIAIAYLLNPVLMFLSKLKIPRLVSIIFVLTLFFAFLILVVTLSAPPLYREASSLAQNIPGYIDKLIQFASPYLSMAQEKLGGDYVTNIKSFLQDNMGKIIQVSGGLAGGLANGGQAVVGFFTTLALTPLVAFFVMLEWPRITAWIDDLIPRRNEKVIKDLFKQIDAKVSGFVRGQITVAFFLGVIYAIALTIADLNYGFLIGISAGFLSIIPMVGSTLGLLVSVIVAWFQAGTWEYVAIIGAIFVVGQLVEGNILTPKLVGDSVGLHPLWVMFALMAGGSLFGILGMLLAVPVAAVVGVLVSFAIIQYKKSPLYKKPPEPKPKKKKAE